MERRRALAVAGSLTITAFAGAIAAGASTGLFGFGNGRWRGDTDSECRTGDAPGAEDRRGHGPCPAVPATAASAFEWSPALVTARVGLSAPYRSACGAGARPGPGGRPTGPRAR